MADRCSQKGFWLLLPSVAHARRSWRTCQRAGGILASFLCLSALTQHMYLFSFYRLNGLGLILGLHDDVKNY